MQAYISAVEESDIISVGIRWCPRLIHTVDKPINKASTERSSYVYHVVRVVSELNAGRPLCLYHTIFESDVTAVILVANNRSAGMTIKRSASVKVLKQAVFVNVAH